MISRTVAPVRCWTSRSTSSTCACTVTSSAVVGSSAMRSVGLVGDAHRDHHALAHPAGELVRVLLDALGGDGDADQLQQLDRACAQQGLTRRRASRARASPRTSWSPTVMHRVERRQRVLEDHRDVVAAERRAAPSSGQPDQLAGRGSVIDPVTFAVAGSRPRIAIDGHALARARLADDAERLAGPHGEAEPVDGDRRAVVGGERHAEVVDSSSRHASSGPLLLRVEGVAQAVADEVHAQDRDEDERRRGSRAGRPAACRATRPPG